MAFDGSSIKGFQSIHESDMTLLPDVTTARVDPFRQRKTLTCNFFVHDPLTCSRTRRDPRNVARKAEEYLASTGIADTCFFGAEAEFYIFDIVQFETDMTGASTRSTPTRAGGTPAATSGGNLGYKVPIKGGYFPVPPYDHYADLREDMTANLISMGFDIERGHHEVGPRPGRDQLQVQHPAGLGRRGDAVQVHHQEHRLGRTARPSPSCRSRCSATTARACTPTSRCGTDGKPLFYDEAGYGGLSDMARYYIGGLLHHAPSLLAFTNPTVNSYHRLVPGYEAPVNLVYSARNRSACIRIPLTGTNAKAKRLEFRCPDPSANPYLAFAAMMMAGLDGIKNKIEPPAPVDKDLYELPPDEAANIPQVPGSLAAVIDRLEQDHDYLLEGGVFTPDLIEMWIKLKRDEIDADPPAPAPVRVRPVLRHLIDGAA